MDVSIRGGVTQQEPYMAYRVATQHVACKCVVAAHASHTHSTEPARVAIALRGPSASSCVLRPTTMPPTDDGRSDAGLTSWADVETVITAIGLT